MFNEFHGVKQVSLCLTSFTVLNEFHGVKRVSQCLTRAQPRFQPVPLANAATPDYLCRNIGEMLVVKSH